MGIVRRDFSPKPAYWAYATLTRVLKGRHVAGKVDAADEVLAYRFEGKGTMIAVWSPDGDRTVSLQVAGKHATLVNAIGESHEVRTGNVRIALHGGAPVYLVEE